jgi:DNA-binding XRE family transcriptional regulator
VSVGLVGIFDSSLLWYRGPRFSCWYSNTARGLASGKRDVLSVDDLSSLILNEAMPKFLHALGREVKRRREELSLSQEKLAEKCGFDRTYISMLERGVRNPSLSNLIKLANGLETSVSQLTEVLDGFNTD